MKNGFRQSMAWLHTWTGLLLGWLVFAIFLTGTIAYFRDEVTLWMQPELHRSEPGPDSAALALARLAELAPGAETWTASLPDARSNTVTVSWRAPGQAHNQRGGEVRVLDAATGEVLAPRETAGGGFLYRFHFELYAMPREWGRLIVGIATVAMFIAIISGVITHKKIFKEFFTFRTGKGQRSWLDMHNMTAVVALPFHVMITFSGLLLFTSTLLPFAFENQRQQRPPAAQVADAPTPAPSAPVRLTDIAPLLEQAQASWGRPVERITVEGVQTGAPQIVLSPAGAETLAQSAGGGGGGARHQMRFDGVTGEFLATTTPGPVTVISAINNGFGTLHRARFADTGLRWLFFLSGVAGTVMVGTGMFLWVSKRAMKHAKSGVTPFGLRLAGVLNVGGIAGLGLACAAYFWANRLLPPVMEARAEAEIRVFFLLWLAGSLYPLVRGTNRAWPELLGLSALLFALLPGLNAATGGLNLGSALLRGNWLLASVDLGALMSGGLLGYAAWRTARRAGYFWSLPDASPSRAGKPAREGARTVPQGLAGE